MWAGAAGLRLVSAGHIDQERVRIPYLGTEKRMGFQKSGLHEQMMPEWREEELGPLQGVGALKPTQGSLSSGCPHSQDCSQLSPLTLRCCCLDSAQVSTPASSKKESPCDYSFYFLPAAWLSGS